MVSPAREAAARLPGPVGGFDAIRSVCYSEIDNDRRPARILVPVNLTSCGMMCRPSGRAQGFAMRFFPLLPVYGNEHRQHRVISFTCSPRFSIANLAPELSVIGQGSR